MLFNLNEDATLPESPNNEQADSSSDSNSDSEEGSTRQRSWNNNGMIYPTRL